VVVGGCCAYVFWVLRPDLIFKNTTPTGGDMGAHVWGPAYLRDFLLPHGRLSGWSPDWYAGFPAYTFYMVVPSLMIVGLDVGLLPWWLAPVAAVAALGVAWLVHRRLHGRLVRALAFAACVVAPILLVDIPYNIAFKLVAVSGLIAFPAAIWYLASGLSLRFPGPELLAVGSIPFLMDKTLFSILGGNIASTMAGEFSFSLSLTFGLFFLGVAARGMATGKHRAWGAVLLALCMLCHVIPAIYIGAASLVMLVMRLRWIEGAKSLGRLVSHPVGWARATFGRTEGATHAAGTWARLKRPLVAAWDALPVPLRWSVPTAAVGVSITLFWYLPFGVLSTYLNDMGWEKYGLLKCNGATQPTGYLREYLKYLYPIAPHQTGCPGTPGTPTDDPNMLHGRVFFILAGVGILLSLLLVVRAGIYFALVGGVAALGFWLMPQHRFWNARILPLYYLCVYLLAALGVWLVVRAVYLLVVGRWAHPPNWINYPVLGLCALVVLMMVQISIRDAPGGYATDSTGAVTTDATKIAEYHWGPFATTYAGPVRDWVAWNYEGYENKPNEVDRHDWFELRGIRDTMTAVGQQHGCGRTFWEYEPNLNRFGTPMALMLLPYWTHSCIGSMEGLFFEASSTTPFHFIVQSELSKQCSCAQRFDEQTNHIAESPYHGVDGEVGIDHLQMLGVKYFMVTSDTMKQVASTDPRLQKVATTGPWDVYEVRDAPLVEGLDAQPAVWSNVDDNIHSWAKPAVDWFTHPEQWDVQMASSGERSWQRVAYPKRPTAKPIEPARVSKVRATRDTISFDVDQVGKPVLVKTSYFPAWETADADGPYRVAPNLMVVVPRSHHVELTYGRTPIEVIGLVLSALGLVLLLLLIRRPEPEGVVAWEMLGDRPDQPAEPEPEPGVGEEPEVGEAVPASEPTEVATAPVPSAPGEAPAP
jgi:hypothetical protein